MHTVGSSNATPNPAFEVASEPCIVCNGPRRKGAAGSRSRKYCDTCSETAKANGNHICVSPYHMTQFVSREVPLSFFYQRWTGRSPRPGSYCKVCMAEHVRESILRKTIKEASRVLAAASQLTGE